MSVKQYAPFLRRALQKRKTFMELPLSLLYSSLTLLAKTDYAKLSFLKKHAKLYLTETTPCNKIQAEARFVRKAHRPRHWGEILKPDVLA